MKERKETIDHIIRNPNTKQNTKQIKNNNIHSKYNQMLGNMFIIVMTTTSIPITNVNINGFNDNQITIEN